MGAISAFTTSALAYVPQPILGEDVAPHIVQARAAVDNLGTLMSPRDEEFKKLNASVATLEGDFQGAVAAHLAAARQTPRG